MIRCPRNSASVKLVRRSRPYCGRCRVQQSPRRSARWEFLECDRCTGGRCLPDTCPQTAYSKSAPAPRGFWTISRMRAYRDSNSAGVLHIVDPRCHARLRARRSAECRQHQRKIGVRVCLEDEQGSARPLPLNRRGSTSSARSACDPVGLIVVVVDPATGTQVLGSEIGDHESGNDVTAQG
jgi:hypothetical protein